MLIIVEWKVESLLLQSMTLLLNLAALHPPYHHRKIRKTKPRNPQREDRLLQFLFLMQTKLLQKQKVCLLDRN